MKEPRTNSLDQSSNGDESRKRSKGRGLMSHKEVKELVKNDPDANKFLGSLLEGNTNVNNSCHTVDPTGTVGSNSPERDITKALERRQVRYKMCKRKITRREGYKWPYYDSYAPGLDMNTKDKRVV